MTTSAPRCCDFLCLPSDEDRLTKFEIDFEDGFPKAEECEALRRLKTVQQVTVSNLRYPHRKRSPQQLPLPLSLAIRSHHPQISKIVFKFCIIDDLGPISMAVAERGNEPPTLQFIECTLRQRAAETIREMLESNAIGGLLFERCNLGEDILEAIAEGLRQNKSLRMFSFTRYQLSDLQSAVSDMPYRNEHLVELALTSVNGDIDFEFFRPAERLQRLRKLSLTHSAMTTGLMEAIMLMCFAVKSLKTLDLSFCVIQPFALDFLARVLSNSHILDSLNLAYMKLTNGVINQRMGKMQVKNLDLSGVDFQHDTFMNLVGDIADNSLVECLDICRLLGSVEKFEPFCDVFLRQSRSPKAVIISDVGPYAEMITEALQQNTSCESLTIGCLGEAGLVTFASGLAGMTGLQHLTIGLQGFEEEYSKEFFQALEESLDRNTTLHRLALCSLHADNDKAKEHLPMIRYYLALNRVGRHSVMMARPPVGIWAHVLARSSQEADGLYFVLTEVPNIVSPSRKRKERDES